MLRLRVSTEKIFFFLFQSFEFRFGELSVDRFHDRVGHHGKMFRFPQFVFHNTEFTPAGEGFQLVDRCRIFIECHLQRATFDGA